MAASLKARSSSMRREAVLDLALDPKRSYKLYRKLASYPPYRTIGRRPARHTMGQAMRHWLAKDIVDQMLGSLDWNELSMRFMTEYLAQRLSNPKRRKDLRSFTYRAIQEFFNRPNVKVAYNKKARTK